MVTLFNNLNTIQPVKIRDRYNSYYTMFIEARKSVDIENYQITEDINNRISKGTISVLNKGDLKGTKDIVKVEIVKDEVKEVAEDVLKEYVSEEVLESDDNVNEDDNSIKDTEESSTNVEQKSNVSENPSVFICDICGNEYASQRGLDMHKARSHNN